MILIVLLSIAIFQGVVLGAIILKSPLFQSRANRYLAGAIFSLSALLLNLVLELVGAYETIPLLRIPDNIGLELLFPVQIFLFIVHQVNHPIIHHRAISCLYIPFISYAVIHGSVDFGTITGLYEIPQLGKNPILVLELLEAVITLMFIPGVLIFAYRFIKFSSNAEEKKWLKQLWFLPFSLLSSFVLAMLLSMFLSFELAQVMQFLALFATLLIHWTAYSGIYKFRLARDQKEIKALMYRRRSDPNDRTNDQSVLPQANETKTTETFTEENTYFRQLEELCISDQIYRDETLDRDKVAEMLGISTGYLSQVVNSVTGDNFSTYINSYRVEAVKSIILDAKFDNYSLLAIGLECGFSSKTTFHNSFKKITGMTPNAYRKMHK